jgi:hypothetical protein
VGDIGRAFTEVQERIERAAADAGRNPGDVKLVAVSKTVPAERVLEGIEAGITILGENYVQEAKEKIEALYSYPVSWHFIGHLQSNKAKYAVGLFDLIHSVDSAKLARELDKRAKKVGKVQPILIQVNISGEETKSGVDPAQVLALVRDIGALENLSVHGLMTMPPFFNAPEKVRPYFRALKQLQDRIRAESIPRVYMDELSMGMSGDFETAIQEGATLVRVGTSIFGRRA